MNKFDIVEKINPADLIMALIEKDKLFPYQLLKKHLNISGDWQENYFNWGRNALYWLFKRLPYKTITFPAFTCPTLTWAAQKAGKNIVLAEIDLVTFNLDINKIPDDTKCLVVVHTFGNPVNIKEIRKKFKNIYIIEDCAHALYSKIDNQFVGNQGDAVLFSLYKQIVNINGAFLLTGKKLFKRQNIESDFKYLKRLIFKTKGFHQWGLNFKRHHYLPGIEPQALSQDKPSRLVLSLFEKGFKKLEREIEGRRRVVKWYEEEVNNYSYLTSQKSSFKASPSYYHFSVYLDPSLIAIRDKIAFSLRKKNIFSARLWPKAPITQKRYKNYIKKCPQALVLAQSVINLPIYSSYNKKDVKYLFSEIDKVIKANND